MKALTLSRPSDWVLPCLAILVLVLGGVSFEMDRRMPPPVWEGRDLLPGLDPDKISRISIKPESGDEVILTREGRQFFVESADRAPADPERVNEVILRLGGAQIARSLGEKDEWKKFGLEEPQYTITVESTNKTRWQLHFGKTLPTQKGLPVRLNDKEDVFVTTEHLWFGQNNDQYISKTAFHLNSQKVSSFEVKSRGKVLPPEKISREDFLGTFSPLKVLKHFRTGSAHQDLAGVNWDWESVLQTEDGVGYNISLGQKDQRWFARAQAMLISPESTSGPILDINSLSARSSVERFNQEKLPWVWEISNDSIEKFKKGLKLN